MQKLVDYFNRVRGGGHETQWVGLPVVFPFISHPINTNTNCNRVAANVA